MHIKQHTIFHPSHVIYCCLALFMGVIPTKSEAIIIRDDVDVGNYVSLANDPLYASAGWLGADIGGSLTVGCSGTLVSSNQVLTAAHCLDSDVDGVADFPLSLVEFGLQANLPGSFTNNVANAVIHPLWDGGSAYDMVILTLTEHILSTPAVLWGGGVYPHSPAVMLGYGDQAAGNFNPINFNPINWGATPPQQRLAATNTIDAVGPGFLRTDFDNPQGTSSSLGDPFPTPTEGTPCYGDSGGPLFVNGGNLVGITHGGSDVAAPCSGSVVDWTPIGSPENVQFLKSQGLTVAIPEPPVLWLFIIGLIAVRFGVQKKNSPM